MKRLFRHPRTLALGAQALGAYLRFALRTTRWTLHGRDALGPYLLGGAAIFAFWHERLPLMPALWTLAARERGGATQGRMHVLVSRHQDGRLIGSIMTSFGVNVVYGSTTRHNKSKDKDRGGGVGMRALIGVLRGGDQIVITPDGPRGPARQAAVGVAQLAALTEAPIIPCAAQTSARRILPTWDCMVLPLPFGRGVLVCAPPIVVGRDSWSDTLPQIEAALTAAAGQADALCGV